tara:strand:- start:190 stop:2079 length:1890 start_codon:yes stop_codon:yes gene_type:complete
MVVQSERRYAVISGFYPTASRRDSQPQWKYQNSPQGLLQVQGVDWDGKPNFNATHKIRGNQVWYERSPTLKGAAKAFDKDVNDANALLDNFGLGSGGQYLANYTRFMGQGEPYTALGASMIKPFAKSLGSRLWGAGRTRQRKLGGRELFDQRRLRSVDPDENPASVVFRDLFEEYRNRSSIYAQQLQRDVVEQINRHASGAAQQMGGISYRNPRDWMTHYRGLSQGQMGTRDAAHGHRAATEEQMSPEEAGYEPIGATQPMDAYVRIGNRITGVDLSEEVGISGSEQSRTHHHSLTNGAIMDEYEFWTSDRDTIRQRMRDYYTTEIDQRWNPTIRNIREIAQDHYGHRQVTPEEMRNPLGGMHAAGRQGEQPSLPVNDAIRSGLFASEHASSTQNKATQTHIFHWLGNYTGNWRGAFDTFTLSHRPVHITAGVFLRQYAASNRSRAYEFKNVRKGDTYVWDGPALYNIGRMNGYYANRTAAQFTDDARIMGLACRAYGSRGTIAVVNGSNLAVNGVARPKVAMDMFIPDMDTADFLEDMVMDMADKSSDDFYVQHMHQFMQSNLREYGRARYSFNDYLKQYGERLAEQNSIAPTYRFWATPFYGTEFVGDTGEGRTRKPQGGLSSNLRQ